MPQDVKQHFFDEALRLWTGYWEKTKKQAESWSCSEYDKECEFFVDMLVFLKSPAWSARDLAELVLSGKDEYQRYLDGLGYVPTAAQIKAITAPTPDQLRGMGVYLSLLEHNGIEYRYGGSGTAQNGVGQRFRGYEKAKENIDNGHKTSPSMHELKHLNVLLQKDTVAFWRLRWSCPRDLVSPIMVQMVEAALIDFERTMSEDLPSDPTSAWSNIHSAAMLQKSKDRFPNGRSAAVGFRGLNRCSPYKQRPNIGVRLHRSRVARAAGWKCSCCYQVKKSKTKHGSIDKDCRLAAELNLRLSGLNFICDPCATRLRKDPASRIDLKAFVTARRIRGARREMRKEAKRTGKNPNCPICSRTFTRSDMTTFRASSVPGSEGQASCATCYDSWLRLVKKKGGADKVEDSEVQSFIQGRLKHTRSKAPSNKPTWRCVTCTKDFQSKSYPCHLADFKGSDARWCHTCASAWSKHPRHGKMSLKEEREWHEARKLKGSQDQARKAATACGLCNEPFNFTYHPMCKLPGYELTVICTPCERLAVAFGETSPDQQEVDEWWEENCKVHANSASQGGVSLRQRSSSPEL